MRIRTRVADHVKPVRRSFDKPKFVVFSQKCIHLNKIVSRISSNLLKYGAVLTVTNVNDTEL